MEFKRINGFKVPELQVGAGDARPILGGEMIPHLYCSMFIAAKKNSGKTTNIAFIIDQCAGEHTKVVVFSSTLLNDPKWELIEAKHRKKGKNAEFIGYESLIDLDTKENHLKLWLDERKREAEEIKKQKEAAEAERKERARLRRERKKGVKPAYDPNKVWGGNAGALSRKPVVEVDEDEVVVVTKPKSSHRMPEWFFVFDDFSEELRNKSLEAFIKKHRHFKTKCIISSQALMDIPPGIRTNTDIWLFYRGLTEAHLKVVHLMGTIGMPFPEFMQTYKRVTGNDAEPYDFLYVDTSAKPEIRKNFDERLV